VLFGGFTGYGIKKRGGGFVPTGVGGGGGGYPKIPDIVQKFI